MPDYLLTCWTLLKLRKIMKLTAVFSDFQNYTDEPKEELCNICLLIYVSNTKHQTWLISLWQNLENDASHHCFLAFRITLIGPRGNYIQNKVTHLLLIGPDGDILGTAVITTTLFYQSEFSEGRFFLHIIVYGRFESLRFVGLFF